MILEIYKCAVQPWKRYYEGKCLDQDRDDDVPSTESSSDDDEPAKHKRIYSRKHEDSDSGNDE